MAGVIVGAALQLQQAALWPVWRYGILVGAASLALYAMVRTRAHGRGALAALLMLAALAGAGLTGWRAARYANEALDPSLEGRDLQVIGLVAQMPQHDEGGTRFRLDVELAQWAAPSTGEPPLPRVPRRIALGWYAEGTGLWGRGAEEAAAGPLRRPAALHAGERWRSDRSAQGAAPQPQPARLRPGTAAVGAGRAGDWLRAHRHPRCPARARRKHVATPRRTRPRSGA
jgi:competence protein ComEC